MRSRVQRASGIPCALFIFEGEDYLQTSGELSREIEKLRFVVIARSTCDDLSAEARRAKAEAIHSFFGGGMDCFAEPVIGRAFARPDGSQ
jgi:hypothetical protein